MEMTPNLHSREPEPLRGIRLFYLAILTTLAVVLTILQPGGPL
jgi:hypothetical protein